MTVIRRILAEKGELVAQIKSVANTDVVHMNIMKTAQNWSRYYGAEGENTLLKQGIFGIAF